MGAKLLQPTMTAGEVSPELFGRVDINRYGAGLRRCRNFVVRPYGGVETRAGLRFVARAPTPVVGSHRLLPFVFADGVSYLLVFGDKFLRFVSSGAEVVPVAPDYASGTTYALNGYTTSGGLRYRSLQAANTGNAPATSPSWWVRDDGLQIATPWSISDIRSLRYTQSADVMYLVDGIHAPRTLSRTAANVFVLETYKPKEGPFRALNADESVVVAASAVMGTVTLTANADIFTANAVGSLFYLEPKNLGKVKPWVVGDRGITVGTLRRNDGKTYKAVTVPGGGAWTETGNQPPIHEDGRAWDGAGTSKTNGADTWYVGVEWEYQDGGFGVVEITSVTNSKVAVGTVTKRLPASVVGGVGTPGNTWNLTGDGTTRTFAIAGAGYGVFAVTIGGVPVQSDPNYQPPPPAGGGSGPSNNRPVGELRDIP